MGLCSIHADECAVPVGRVQCRQNSAQRLFGLFDRTTWCGPVVNTVDEVLGLVAKQIVAVAGTRAAWRPLVAGGVEDFQCIDTCTHLNGSLVTDDLHTRVLVALEQTDTKMSNWTAAKAKGYKTGLFGGYVV